MSAHESDDWTLRAKCVCVCVNVCVCVCPIKEGCLHLNWGPFIQVRGSCGLYVTIAGQNDLGNTKALILLLFVFFNSLSSALSEEGSDFFFSLVKERLEGCIQHRGKCIILYEYSRAYIETCFSDDVLTDAVVIFTPSTHVV